MQTRVFFLLSLIIFSYAPVQKKFYDQQVVATIEDVRLVEASGLEASFLNSGYLWTHNDSGAEPILYLLNKKAEIVMEVELKGVKNRDWEEIVTVREGKKAFIYIAEIGDNEAIHDEVRILRIAEPVFEGDNNVTVKKSDIDIMSLQYEEGARDAESLLYDSSQGEFVLVTKREDEVMVYAFSFEKNKRPVTIKSKGRIPARSFTAADMNEQGEILLKNYDSIYYWGPSTNAAIDRILAWDDAITIDYTPEPQGEAICWYQNDFYTISEKNKGKPQEMLFFKRID